MNRIALFAHYDAQNEVKRFIVHLLAEVRRVCDDIVFLSTSKLSDAELDKVRPFASRTRILENKGYDFGMWKHGCEMLDLAAVDELVLVNSSVFGPLSPLDAYFAKMRDVDCDFWAMTDNTDIDWHLQSYFLVLRKKVIADGALTRFLGTVLSYRNKDQVVRSYEIGLTIFLVEHGYKSAAVVPCTALDWSNVPKRRRKNPTCFHPTRLLDLGMPFVKIELLRDNPGKVALGPVYARMRDMGYDMTMVEFDRPVQNSEPLLARLLGSSRSRGGR
jgi:rhamnosyltransferase